MYKVSPFRAQVGATQGSGVYGAGSTGVEHIVSEFTSFVRHIQGSAPNILFNALEPTFELSQTYVPRRTGALANSGYLEIVGVGEEAVVEMGYGRNGYPAYAPIVHEDTTMPHAEPTRAQFLLGALQEDFFAILGRVALQTKVAGGLL